MAGKKGQKKRFWSDEEKVAICVQTRAPEVSVAQVARWYSMNTNLIQKNGCGIRGLHLQRRITVMHRTMMPFFCPWRSPLQVLKIR